MFKVLESDWRVIKERDKTNIVGLKVQFESLKKFCSM